MVDQRAFELGECLGVDGGLVAELACKRVEVDVVHGRARITLRQLLGELLQLADVGQRLRAFTHAQRVVAGELRRAIPVLTGPGCLQVGIEPIQRLHQRRRSECLLRQRIQLGTLIRAQAVAEPLRGRRPLGQRIQQLLDILRVLRKELAVLVHEVVKILLGVLPLECLSSRPLRSLSISLTR